MTFARDCASRSPRPDTRRIRSTISVITRSHCNGCIAASRADFVKYWMPAFSCRILKRHADRGALVSRPHKPVSGARTPTPAEIAIAPARRIVRSVSGAIGPAGDAVSGSAAPVHRRRRRGFHRGLGISTLARYGSLLGCRAACFIRRGFCAGGFGVFLISCNGIGSHRRLA